jgi:pimeloyl-ACP methyl ester carboxylesterase
MQTQLRPNKLPVLNIALPNQSNTIAKKTHGSGQIVVLLHGFAGSHKHWNNVIRHMPPNKFHIVTPDSIGFGMSDKPSELRYDIDDHSEALAKDILENTDQQIILVGHSMGAMIALRIAKQHPELVKKLVLINPPIFTSPEHAKRVVMGSFPLIHRVYVGKFGVPIYLFRNDSIVKYLLSASLSKKNDLGNIIDDYFNHTRRSFILSLRNTIFEYSMYDDLQHIPMTTKYIYSSTDPFYDPASLNIFKKYPNMQTIEISGGHRIPFVNPKQVASEICT